MSEDKPGTLIWESRMFLWIVQLVVGLLLAGGGYVLNNVIRRIESIETDTKAFGLWRAEVSGNRFTNADGLAVWKEIADVKRDIATLPSSLPPAWFVQRVDRIEKQLEVNAQKIDEMMKDMRSKP